MRRAEALVLTRIAPEPLGERPCHRASIPLDGHVEVHRVRAAKQVADGAAHEVGSRKPGESGQQPLRAGQAPDALAELGGACRHSRTGIPAARIRSLASRTVCCP